MSQRSDKPDANGTGRWSIPGPGSKTSEAPQRQRTWDPEEWEEDQRFVEAMDLVSRGYKREALTKLVQLCQDDENHVDGRLQVLFIAIELKLSEVVEQHIEWALYHQGQIVGPEGTAEIYTLGRQALPDLPWTEKALVTALVAGEKAKNHRVVVDATKMLMLKYPESVSMPRAFMASAEVQIAEGRADLAAATLSNVISRYPMDPLVPLAERRLKEVQTVRASMAPPKR